MKKTGLFRIGPVFSFCLMSPTALQAELSLNLIRCLRAFSARSPLTLTSAAGNSAATRLVLKPMSLLPVKSPYLRPYLLYGRLIILPYLLDRPVGPLPQ